MDNNLLWGVTTSHLASYRWVATPGNEIVVPGGRIVDITANQSDAVGGGPRVHAIWRNPDGTIGCTPHVQFIIEPTAPRYIPYGT